MRKEQKKYKLYFLYNPAWSQSSTTPADPINSIACQYKNNAVSDDHLTALLYWQEILHYLNNPIQV